VGNILARSSWLPPELTPTAHSVDGLFYILLAVVTVMFLLVEFLLIFFLIRYRRTKRNQVGYNIHGNLKAEILWTLIPTLVFVFLGAYSVKYVYSAQTPPAPQVKISVVGHEWYWEFKYPNGVVTQNDLRVPAGENVLFDITSADVIHGFYIPSARMQQDALPGRLTDYSIDVDKSDIGKVFPVPCDQFCGQGHPTMIAHMTVMSPAGYQNWLKTQLQKQKAGSGS